MRDDLLNRSWAEVNLDAISHNVKSIKEKIKRTAELMGVVKADAYGHGIKEIIPVLLENGVTRLAVSMLDEAIELRKNNVSVPILVLSYTDPRRAREIILYNITQTVYSKELASALSVAGKELEKEVRIHIKVDTGMGRVGFMAGFGAIKSIIEIQKMPNIVIEGLYTHFACADEEDTSYTLKQFEQFMSICSELGRVGIQIPIKHVCNSAATIRFPFMHLDMVRVGILLYGMSPSGFFNAKEDGFVPAMQLKTNVILVKDVETNQSISYGRKFITSKPSVIATIPIGYADGYSRSLSNKASVLIRGKRYSVVGSICMDTCMVDVTINAHEFGSKFDYKSFEDAKITENFTSSEDNKLGDDVEISNDFKLGEKVKLGDAVKIGDEVKLGDAVKLGDEVVLFGCQGEEFIDIDEIASLMNTINYEVTCVVGKRVPRAYIKNGEIKEIKNYLIGE